MLEAVVIMLNNYFHDLMVAFLFSTCVLARLVLREWPGKPSPRVVRILSGVTWTSLGWILLGGTIRLWFYREYEWLPRAGTAQIPALIVKHLLLIGLTIWGLAALVKLRRMMKKGVPDD